MNKTLTITIVVTLLIVGAGYLVYSNLYSWPELTNTNLNPFVSNGSSSRTTPTNTETNTTGTVKNFTISAENFSFSPSSITVNKGDRVRITFKNKAGTHDWRIDELGVMTQKLSGENEEVVEFIAQTAGVYEYYCSVGNHRAMGMKGTLNVQ